MQNIQKNTPDSNSYRPNTTLLKLAGLPLEKFIAGTSAPVRNCNRCGKRAGRKGRISASVTLPSGRVERKYLCRFCVGDLQAGVGL